MIAQRNLRSLAIAAGALLAAAGAGAARIEQQQCPIAPDARVEIRNIAGTIEVSAWDQPMLSLEAELGDGIERIEYRCAESSVYIEAIYKKRAKDGWAKLRVRAPAGVSVDAEGVSAGIALDGIAGALDIETVSGKISAVGSAARIDADTTSGDVHIEGGAAEVEVESVSGNVEVQGSAGALQAKTASGNIRAHGAFGTATLDTISGAIEAAGTLARVEANSVSGDVRVDRFAPSGGIPIGGRVNSVSGNVDLTGDGVAELDVETMSGDFRYDGAPAPGARISAGTQSGRIELHLPAEFAARYLAETLSGGIESAFGTAARAGFGPGSRLEHQQGDGSALVRLESVSGPVRILAR